MVGNDGQASADSENCTDDDPDDLNVTIGGVPVYIPGTLVRSYRDSPRGKQLRARIAEAFRSEPADANG